MEEKIVKKGEFETTDFPEQWVVEGDNNPPMFIDDNTSRPKNNNNHWFNKVCGKKRNINFNKQEYYSKNIHYTKIPENHVLVTKEQLIKHFNIKLKQDEIQRKNFTNRDSKIKSRARISNRRQQGATGSRLKGNVQSFGKRYSQVRRIKIRRNVVIRSHT